MEAKRYEAIEKWCETGRGGLEPRMSRVSVRALKWAGYNGVRNGTVLTVVRYACRCPCRY